MGFTHIELLPVTEHPFDGSWGYQPIGLFAPTSRFGPPGGLRALRRALPRGRASASSSTGCRRISRPTRTASARFDGTALYEHADPRQGFHRDWNTLIYNFGRREVANFLRRNALFWLDRYHIDGLRVDAVASMLYLDYSRKAGEWVPNIHGGNENLEAIALPARLNERAYGEHPGRHHDRRGIDRLAAGVAARSICGGLGFGYKWNMGWMHDTLDYMRKDPVHRKHHHHQTDLRPALRLHRELRPAAQP